MSGATILAALGGQRAGAGYVELLGNGDAFASHSLVRRGWSDRAFDDDRIGAIVVGPGLGLDRAARTRLEVALACGKPLLLDADALTLIGKARHDRLAGRAYGDSEGRLRRHAPLRDRRARVAEGNAAARPQGA